jgi:hypothetical protein
VHVRPANGAVFKVAPDILQVLPVGVAVWLICRGRLEKLVDLAAGQMWVQRLLLYKRLRGQKAFRCGLDLVVYREPGLSHALTQVSGNTQDDAFDALGAEPDSGEFGDGARRKAGAVMEPENLAVTFLVGPGNRKLQMTGDFIDQQRALDGLWTA